MLKENCLFHWLKMKIRLWVQAWDAVDRKYFYNNDTKKWTANTNVIKYRPTNHRIHISRFNLPRADVFMVRSSLRFVFLMFLGAHLWVKYVYIYVWLCMLTLSIEHFPKRWQPTDRLCPSGIRWIQVLEPQKLMYRMIMWYSEETKRDSIWYPE